MSSQAGVLAKLKQLVTTNQLLAAQELLQTELAKHPNDIALLTHMGGLQTSLHNTTEAEEYLQRAISLHPKQSGSARVQLMRLYSSQQRFGSLIRELESALAFEPDSISLQQQLLNVLMQVSEFDRAVKVSRELISRMQSALKQAQTQKFKDYINSNASNASNASKNAKNAQTENVEFERVKYLVEPKMQSEMYFMHSQILNKLGRYADGMYYCQKALDTIVAHFEGTGSSGGQKKQALPRNASQIYGYLGLCRLNNDQIDTALQAFNEAVKLHPNDATSIKNIVNIKHNRNVFENCKKLKKEVGQYETSGKEGTSLDKDAMREKYVQYFRLLIQVSRSATVKNQIEQWLDRFNALGGGSSSSSSNAKNENEEKSKDGEQKGSNDTNDTNGAKDPKDLLLGYHVPQLMIVYEDVLRNEISVLTSKLAPQVRDMLEGSKLRSDYGPVAVHKHNPRQRNFIDNNLVLAKIWKMRMKIDESYQKAVELTRSDSLLHVAYTLAMWRLGYTADGIFKKTQGWIESNDAVNWESMPKLFMARGNAFMNEAQNELALKEFTRALKISLHEQANRSIKSRKEQMKPSATKKESSNAIETASEALARERADEIQTRLLMVVLLNKMNDVKAAANHCEAILAYDETHESARKLYAAILLRQKRYKESKRIFSSLLQSKRYDKNTVFEYVNLLSETKEFDVAKKRLQTLLQRHPFDSDVLFQFGVVCGRNKDYKESTQALRNILKRDPSFLKAYPQMISVLRDELSADETCSKPSLDPKERHKEIREQFERWIQASGTLHSSTARTQYLEYLWDNKRQKQAKRLFGEWTKTLKNEVKLASMELNQNRSQPAEEKSDSEASGATGSDGKDSKDVKDENDLLDTNSMLSEKVSKLNVLLSDIYQQYGRLLLLKKTHLAKQAKGKNSKNEEKKVEDGVDAMNNEIVDCFETALKYCEESTDALRGFAGFQVSVQQYEKALPLLKKALDLQPANANSRIQLSILLRKLESGVKGRKEAIELLLEGVDVATKKGRGAMDTSLKMIYEVLVDLYILNGDMTGADQCVWKLLEVDPVNEMALRSVHSTCTDEEKVTEMFETTCANAPSSVSAKAEYANFLFIKKKFDEAKKWFKKAIEQGPNHCAAHYMYGFLLLQTDEKDEADKYFRKAVQIDPENFYARLNLGQYLLSIKDLDGAMEHCDHAYNLSKDSPVIIAIYSKLLVMRADQIKSQSSDGSDANASGASGEDPIEMMKRADKMCDDALHDFPGHVALLMSRSSIFKVMSKYGLPSLSSDDIAGAPGQGANNANGSDARPSLVPQTTYGMVGISIAKPQDLAAEVLKQNKSTEQDETDGKDDADVTTETTTAAAESEDKANVVESAAAATEPNEK